MAFSQVLARRKDGFANRSCCYGSELSHKDKTMQLEPKLDHCKPVATNEEGGGAYIFDQKKVPVTLNIFLKENVRHLTLKNAELFTHKNGFNFLKY